MHLSIMKKLGDVLQKESPWQSYLIDRFLDGYSLVIMFLSTFGAVVNLTPVTFRFFEAIVN